MLTRTAAISNLDADFAPTFGSTYFGDGCRVSIDRGVIAGSTGELAECGAEPPGEAHASNLVVLCCGDRSVADLGLEAAQFGF